MKEPKHVIVGLDCENLFKSARIIFGENSYVDYTKVTNFMLLRLEHRTRLSLEEFIIHKVAFFSLKPEQYTQLNFLCFLASLGYRICALNGIINPETLDLQKDDAYFDWIKDITLQLPYVHLIKYAFFACGSVQMKPLYNSLLDLGAEVEVFGFGGSVSKLIRVEKHMLDQGFLLT